MARKVTEALNGGVRGRRVGVLGVTFKPNTDDIRESPSLSIIQALQDAGATVAIYDPKGMNNARTTLAHVEWTAGPYECARDASALVIVTEWDEFRTLDFAQLGKVMQELLLIDLRNLYRGDDLARWDSAISASAGRTRPWARVLLKRPSDAQS